MTYYDTIEEDLKRTREILKEGRMADEEFEQLYAGWPDELREHVREFFSGGTIYGKDTYAAYRLLESLANEVERLQQLLQNYIDHIDTSRLPAIAAAAGRRVEELEQQIKDIQSARTVFGDVKGRDLDLILGPSQASITCPDCKRTSYNRNDVKHRYCGFCHKSIDPL